MVVLAFFRLGVFLLHDHIVVRLRWRRDSDNVARDATLVIRMHRLALLADRLQVVAHEAVAADGTPHEVPLEGGEGSKTIKRKADGEAPDLASLLIRTTAVTVKPPTAAAPPPAKKQKTAATKEKEEDGDDDEMDWEDAIDGDTTAMSNASSSKKPELEIGDIDVSLNEDGSYVEEPLVSLATGKKGPSKRERQIRLLTHCLHVHSLMWHNTVRDSWLNDK